MKFSNWMQLKESEQAFPQVFDILYTCCVLHKNSQQALLGTVRRWMFGASGSDIPKGWTGRSHHMTIKFKPKQADVEALSDLFGKSVNLTVTDWAFDEHGIAVVVQPNVSLNIGQIPHITVAHSRAVGAVYSNTLLGNKSKWLPASDNLVLESFVVGVKSDNTTIWPDLPEPLAAPSLLI